MAAIFGVVELVRHGVGLKYWPYTYLPLLGGLASCVAIVPYVATIKAPSGRSWRLVAGALSMFIPYLFSLYLMGFLGVWMIVRAVTSHPFAWGHVLAGVFWVLFGWRMLFMLGEVQRQLSRNAATPAPT